MKGFPRFTAPFPARRLTILCAAIFQLVSGGSAWSQNQPIPEAGAAATGVSFFEANDRLLDTISPIDLGGERFARRLDFVRTMREPLGLVLSGGSARAFAHIGVLKALEEKGVRPDYIVANSMGAIVGMMYAAGFSPDSIESLVSDVAIGSLIDPVFPLAGGFVNADRFAAFVRSIVGDVDIADLPIPIMIIFEDLESRRQVRVMKGNFADVMAASFALPGIFEPARFEGYTLIDGGITNLVPTSAARDYSRAVVVSATMYDKAMKFSNPFTVINRAIDIGKTRNAIQELVDLKPIIIRNDVENISYMEFSRPRGIIARGYTSAQAMLPEILSIAGQVAPDPALLEKNALYAPLVQKAIDDFAKGNDPPNIPDTLVVPTIRIADEPAGEGSFDLGRRYIGFRALRRDGAITTGVGLDFSLGDDPSHAWGLVFQASARPRGGFFARVESRLSGAWRPISSGIPLEPRSIEIAGKTGFVFGGGNLLGSVFAGAEFGVNFLPSDMQWRAFSGFSARTHKLRPVAGDFSLDWFVDSRNNAGPEWTARLASRLSAPVGLRLRTAGRYSVFGTGSLLSIADGYRGPFPAPATIAPAWLIGNAEAVLRATFLEFDAGEMIIVQNIEFSPFFDIAWDGSPPEMAAGISASVSISLLGVTPFDFSLAVSRSLAGPAWRVSFNTGKLFR